MKRTLTLSTDLSASSPELNIIKHLLLEGFEQPVGIVDFAHNNFQLHFFEVGVFVGHHFRLFGEGSIHVLLCDIFNNYKGFFLLAEKEGHWFVAPDNGILSVVNSSNVWDQILCISLGEKIDLFSIVKELSTHLPQILEGKFLATSEITDWAKYIIHRPVVSERSIQGCFIYVDGFGNAVSNITHSIFSEISKERKFKIFFGVTREPISEVLAHYGSVKKGTVLARFNDVGFLEIAVNHGNASRLFGLRSVYSASLNAYHHHNIKVIFE